MTYQVDVAVSYSTARTEYACEPMIGPPAFHGVVAPTGLPACRAAWIRWARLAPSPPVPMLVEEAPATALNGSLTHPPSIDA